LRGSPLDERGLANLLRRYDVRPTKIRLDMTGTRQGYRRADLWDAWQRYAPTPAEAEHPEQAEQKPPATPIRSGCSGSSGRAEVNDWLEGEL